MMPVIAITGPTAVGKSALAEDVALALDTEVLSADAMQVYRGMDIGTAKVPKGERRVPLRLVDLVDPSDAYSAARYQRDARDCIGRLRASDRVPVFCGGSGLYLRAALDDLRFPAGQVGDVRRRGYQALAEDQGAAALHALLAERDPKSAALIHPNNVKRVVRALEMCDEGVSYAEQAAGFSQPRAWCDHVDFALTMDRARLYERIDARVDQMMADGLVEEVRSLLAAGAGPALTARQAIGYQEIIQALEGETSLDEAVELIKRRTRRYAKRQLAWCRRDPRITWIDVEEHSRASTVALILKRVGAHGNG